MTLQGRSIRLWLLSAALPALVLASLFIGAYPVAPGHLLAILASMLDPLGGKSHPVWTQDEQVVVQLVRLPRIAMATFAGVGLGVAGATLQGVFRNPLVGPDIIGVSAGAAFGGAFAILFGWPSEAVVAGAAVGALLALGGAVLLTSLTRPADPIAFILAGVVSAAFFSALLTLVEFLADPQSTLPSMIYWLLGSFAGANGHKALVLGVPTAVGSALLLGLRWRINLLSLGDADARALGVPVALMRWTVILAASTLVAAQVAVSGIVGWVGLLVPHLARSMVGPDHRRLLPASALVGGIFMLGIDDIARTAASQELPIGLLTALVGTPVFAFLFWRTQGRSW